MEDLFKVTGEVTLKKGGGRELKAGVCGYMITKLIHIPVVS